MQSANKFHLYLYLVKKNMGFSLVEILIALTILGFAGTFVVGKIFEQLEEGQIKSATIQMSNFKNILSDYRRKCGSFPSTEAGLEALIQKPADDKECKNYPANGFLQEALIPNDPWDESYVYESDGRSFKITSYGPDRDPETDDDLHYPDLKKKN